jgi:hypothetical protein
MSSKRNILTAATLSLVGAWGAYAYVQNRVAVNITGTVSELSIVQTKAGAQIDAGKPVVLDSGKRLGIGKNFEGGVLEVGECYDFEIKNTVSAKILQGVEGDITRVSPCASVKSVPVPR